MFYDDDDDKKDDKGDKTGPSEQEKKTTGPTFFSDMGGKDATGVGKGN
jgi:hypothetical protein